MLGILKRTAIAVVALGVTATATLASDITVSGAGSSFADPICQKWVTEYQKIHPDIKITYQGIGSGGGVKGITEKTIQFAGSDAPLSKSEITALGGEDKVVQFPSTAGGVVPAYNLPGVSGEVKFSGEILAGIYMGTIAKWDDPKIKELNPGLKLPGLTITPAWRTDGSGTTYVWTNYLCTQSEDFKGAVGAGKSVKFPAGQGGAQNAGVAAIVQQTPGAIGYIEQAYADKNHIPYGSVKNKSGKFVKASPATVSAAGAGAVGKMKGHVIAADIWDQPGDESYPIASFTYLIVYSDLNNLKSKDQAEALVGFLKWVVHDGQSFTTDLDYAPLAPAVQAKDDEALKTISYEGASLASR